MQSGSGRYRAAAQVQAEAREAALRSAARLLAARASSEHRVRVVLAQRRLDRERREAADADRLWSMYRPVNRLPVR